MINIQAIPENNTDDCFSRNYSQVYSFKNESVIFKSYNFKLSASLVESFSKCLICCVEQKNIIVIELHLKLFIQNEIIKHTSMTNKRISIIL